MKKTCNGCRAYNGNKCDLGKKTEPIYMKWVNTQIEVNRKPLEECHKPKTYSQLIHILKIKQ